MQDVQLYHDTLCNGTDVQTPTFEHVPSKFTIFNTLRTGDANLRFYITTAQDG